jgi:hypothetical protein
MKRKNRKVEEVEEGFYDKTLFPLSFFDFFDFAVQNSSLFIHQKSLTC